MKSYRCSSHLFVGQDLIPVGCVTTSDVIIFVRVSISYAPAYERKSIAGVRNKVLAGI
jgi:hypothetical protein